jgi:hypothetical protein
MLPCFDEYTLFAKQLYNISGLNVEIHGGIFTPECATICYNNELCQGFNFKGDQLQCVLLFQETFSPLELIQTNNVLSGFYMSSYSTCNSFDDISLSPFFIILLALFLFCCPVFCICFSRRRRSTIRSISQTALIETHEQVPPPYRSITPTSEESVNN